MQEIEKRLNGDSTLQNDLTYSGFAAHFDIKIRFSRSLTKETTVWGHTDVLPEVKALGEHEVVEGPRIVGDYESTAPNLERQSHDLPIPVMVSTPSGLERRKVRIERQGKK